MVVITAICGSPVPDAMVSLRYDGQPWQPGPLAYPDSRNPQSSGNRSDNAGTYLFGVLSPGQYQVTAEKYGHSGSANVTIASDVMLYPLKVNVTIADLDVWLSGTRARDYCSPAIDRLSCNACL